MSKIEKFEDLRVWKLARDICRDVNEILKRPGVYENRRLKDQMEGSSGSIMDNIAEGYGRGGNKEFKTFLGYSKGSCSELKSQLYRCYDKDYINSKELKSLLEKTDNLIKQLGGFIRYLKNSDFKGSRLSEPDLEYQK